MRIENLFCGIVVTGLMVLCTFDTLAQRKMISGRDYDESTGKPSDSVYERSRRVVITDETLVDGIVTKTIESVTEVLKPDRSHYYSKVTEGGKISEFEQIDIDYMRYSRRDGGTWTKVDTRQSGLGSGSGMGTGSSRTLDQYSVEPVVLNGVSMQMYERLFIDGSGKELTFTQTRRWIGDDGLLYHSEYSKGKLSPKEEDKRVISSYEYDPNIKIEPPIK